MVRNLIIREAHVDWILAHRLRLLIAITVLTLLAVLSLRQVPLRVSVLQGLMSDETQVESYRRRAALFGGDSDNLVYVATREGPQLFSPRTLHSIHAAARELESRPEIKRVVSITDLPRLTPDNRRSIREIIARTIFRNQLIRGEVPQIADIFPAPRRDWPNEPARRRSMDRETLRSEMLDDPLTGRLLAEEGNAQAMLIWLDESADLHNQPQSGIRATILEVLKRHGLGQNGFYCAGTLVIQDWMFHEAILALKLVLPVTAAILALLVYGIFRRVSYVLVNLTIAGIAILWTLGVAATIYGEITLLVAATPALVLIISTADTIHLTSAYAAELEAGLTRDRAVRKVFREVGGACLLTSVTTLVGFLSLMVVPAVMVRQMALACAVGVASALLLALAIVPVALTLLPPPPTVHMARSRLNHWIERVVTGCQWTSLNYPRTVVAAHLLVILAAAICVSQIEFDADLAGRFHPSHPLRQSIDFFHREVTGTTTIDVFLDVDADQIFTPEITRGMAAFEQRLTTIPEVRDVLSVTTLYRFIDQLAGIDAPDGLPETERTAAAMYELAARHSPLAAHSVVAPETGLLRVVVQVTPTRVLSVLRYAEQIEQLASETLPPQVNVDSSGYCSIIGNAVRVVLLSQAKGFVICLASVTLVLMIGIRSIRLSLLALLPNILPLLLLGGILTLTFEVVDPDVLGIAIVSFGLAVDDTIHFLHRYDIEYAGSGDRLEALKNTYRYTGHAIVRTTVILSLGLLPFALSGYLSIRMLGTYLVFVLACAILGDLLLLPSLILSFTSKRKRTAPDVAA